MDIERRTGSPYLLTIQRKPRVRFSMGGKSKAGSSQTNQDDGSENNEKSCVSPMPEGNTGHLFGQDGGVSGENRDVPPTHGGSSNNRVSSTEKSSRGDTTRDLMARKEKTSPLGQGSGPSASDADRSPPKCQNDKTKEFFQRSGGESYNEICRNLNLHKETREVFQRNDNNLPKAKDVAGQADGSTRDLFEREKTATGQGSTTGKTPPKGDSDTTSETPSEGVSDAIGETPPKDVSRTNGETSPKGASSNSGGTKKSS